MNRLAVILSALLALAIPGAAVLASPDVPPGVHIPSWNELDRDQQADLSGFAGRWDRLPPSRRLTILQKHARWRSLPEGQREMLREGARNFREMSPEQREKMRISMQAVRHLPPVEQRRLRQAWRAMSPQQRRAWLQRGGPGVAPPPRFAPLPRG